MAKSIKFNCTNCAAPGEKRASLIKEGQTAHFCSRSCSASYNNKKREQGTKVSKLEKWLQPRLEESYPDITFEFNKKTIGSELDIYIPAMKLAFEINGRFHYVPVFSEQHLQSVQKNDRLKAEQCRKSGVELVTVDASSLKFLTHKKGWRYLAYIMEKIDEIRNRHS